MDLGSGRLVNFAQYVTMQGGLVVFTQEFARFLASKYGKKIDFQKEFNNWWKKGEGRINFIEYLLSHLTEPSFNEYKIL